MKKLIFLSMSFGAFFSHAQLNTNTLLPYGNVGVGTLFPSAKLEVKGSTLLQGLTVTGDALFKANALFQKDLQVGGNAVLQATTILGTFRVPQVPVAASAQTGLQVLLRDPVTGTVYAGLFDIPIIGNPPPQPITCPEGTIANPDWQSGSNKLYVHCPQVNVGIGTNSPVKPLHVNGDALFNNNMQINQTMTIGVPTSATEGLLKVHAHIGTAIEVRFTNTSATVFKATSSNGTFTPFILEASGRITVSNQTRKILQLNPDGTLLTRTVQVDAVNWPDYVFESNYRLMPLTELNTYIQQNKHLPNVPSASVAETNGIDLGEMNKVLLEKTEEMTLYILQQQKQLDAQQQQIDELKAQMQLLLNKH